MRIASDTVQEGENIVTLTTRLTGEPLRWSEIVALNKLRAPYISESGAPNTLQAGDTVLYPAPDLPIVSINPSQLAAATYKRDWVAQNGDLMLSESGHFVSESGLANLQTALQRRMQTALGRHPFHPAYGSLLYTHVGENADPSRLHLVRVDASRAIMRDPRVQSCVVSAVWEGEILSITADITPIPPGAPFRTTVRL